jgi:hypothetical protein
MASARGAGNVPVQEESCNAAMKTSRSKRLESVNVLENR